MEEPRAGDFFPTDPTAEEVAAEIKRHREQAERHAEAERRRVWDEEHGTLDENVIEGEAEEIGGEITDGT